MRVWWVLVLAAPGLAGNLQSFFLGNDAAIAGGAVTPVVGDAGALWYNPAGLARNRRSQLDISGSAFVLRLRDTPGAVEVGLPGQKASGDVESTELVSVPTSLVFLRQFDGMNVGLGVFVPEQDYLSQVVTTKTGGRFGAGGAPYDYRQQIAITQQSTRYHAGPGAGWSLSPTLRLGVSLFATYETASIGGRFWGDLLVADGTQVQSRGTFGGDFRADFTRIGAEAQVGVQWQAADHLHLGAVLVTPRLAFYEHSAASEFSTFGSVGPETAELDLTYTEAAGGDDGVGAVAPVSGRGGATLAFDGGWVTLEGDYQPAFEDTGRGIEQRAVWNARLGTRVRTSETMAVGAGLFTDRSHAPDPEEIGESRVHYYGVAGGVELRTPVGLRAGQPADSLVFSTTFGLRYALGVGQAGSLRLDLTSEEEIRSPPVDVTWHELALHVGSALYF